MTTSGAPRLDRRLVAVMATATGLSVASNYYAQPLLPAIGRSLHMRPATAGLIVTLSQAGYAAGLLLLLPLGDLFERRRLVVLLSLGTAAALLWMGLAPAAAVLLPAALVVGALSVVTQLLVPFAASLAADDERGQVVGMVMSGLLLGILLARTVAGYLAEAGTWRVAYFAAAGAMLVQAAVLARALPVWREENRLPFGRLIVSVLALYREEPVVRLRSLYGLLSFGTFSALWTSIAFFLSRDYHYSTGTIGLFGIAGAAGAITASLAGRLADRGHARMVTRVSSVLLLAGWLPLWKGAHHVALVIAGIVILDTGAQALHITNQSEIYRLRPEARSRLTSAYMIMFFIGGAGGSLLSALAYSSMGWPGVCLVGAAFALVSMILAAVMAVRPVGYLSAPAPATAG